MNSHMPYGFGPPPKPPEPPDIPKEFIVALVASLAFAFAAIGLGFWLSERDRNICVEKTGLPCDAIVVVKP